jgi:xenotropic and polytropic retrovirus receptor 1
MDISLFQANARYPLLRDILAIKPVWLYYLIMVVDPLLRFSWVFYAIFTYDAQHSTIVSFLVAFAEVSRRGMWTIFRVDNEHCANVAQYKASRDIPLPYDLHMFVNRPSLDGETEGARDDDESSVSDGASARTTGLEVPSSGRTPTATTGTPSAGGEEGVTRQTEEEGQVRRRREPFRRRRSIFQIMAEAHKQDFEKKRKTEDMKVAEMDDDDDDLHSEEENEIVEEDMDIREAEELSRKGQGRDQGRRDDEESD